MAFDKEAQWQVEEGSLFPVLNEVKVAIKLKPRLTISCKLLKLKESEISLFKESISLILQISPKKNTPIEFKF